eukprot:scaffold3151_cov385-Prasinococcus_capsulatus_cf.AAC.3
MPKGATRVSQGSHLLGVEHIGLAMRAGRWASVGPIACAVARGGRLALQEASFAAIARRHGHSTRPRGPALQRPRPRTSRRRRDPAAPQRRQGRSETDGYMGCRSVRAAALPPWGSVPPCVVTWLPAPVASAGR